MDVEKAVNEALHRSPEGLLLQRKLSQKVVEALNLRKTENPVIFGRMRFLEEDRQMKVVALTHDANGAVLKHDLTIDADEVLSALRLAALDFE